MGRSVQRTGAQILGPGFHLDGPLDPMRGVAGKSWLAPIQTSNYSASGKTSLCWPDSVGEKLKGPNRKCAFIFQRQRQAKSERHFNELSQRGATCFIQIIGWLATLKQPLLAGFLLLSLSLCLSYISTLIMICRNNVVENKEINICKKKQKTKETSFTIGEKQREQRAKRFSFLVTLESPAAQASPAACTWLSWKTQILSFSQRQTQIHFNDNRLSLSLHMCTELMPASVEIRTIRNITAHWGRWQ